MLLQMYDATAGVSPSEPLPGRRLRTRLHAAALSPERQEDRGLRRLVKKRQQQQKKCADKRRGAECRGSKSATGSGAAACKGRPRYYCSVSHSGSRLAWGGRSVTGWLTAPGFTLSDWRQRRSGVRWLPATWCLIAASYRRWHQKITSSVSWRPLQRPCLVAPARRWIGVRTVVFSDGVPLWRRFRKLAFCWVQWWCCRTVRVTCQSGRVGRPPAVCGAGWLCARLRFSVC